MLLHTEPIQLRQHKIMIYKISRLCEPVSQPAGKSHVSICDFSEQRTAQIPRLWQFSLIYWCNVSEHANLLSCRRNIKHLLPVSKLMQL